MSKSQHPRTPILDLPPAERNDHLREDLLWSLPELKRCLAASQAAQEEIREFRERYGRLPDGTPLAPRSLRQLHEGRSLYLRLQDQLIDLARRYERLIDPRDAELARLQVDPILRARGVLVSFTAALTLYDNYLSMRSILEDSRLRRLITSPTLGYAMDEDKVQSVIADLNRPRNRKRMRDLVRGYDRISDRLADTGDPDIGFLQLAVESSASYSYAKEAHLGKRLPSDAKLRRERILDGLDELGRGTLGTLSKVFGNGIGLIETRKGKLWQDAALEQHLRSTLRPLDMLLEKTPFRLTDKFIPGHFGHVAVWVGSPGELDALDMWGEPLFRGAPFAGCRADVEAGRSVLEALRTGVQLSSLAEFLNVDDLAVLRPRGLTRAQVRESLLRGFRQVGKQYDFNFEVETVDKITCSELPYHVYPDVAWDTDVQLGQYTISPDQVAEQALGPDGAFELVEFHHDGQPVAAAEALRLMTRLVEGED